MSNAPTIRDLYRSSVLKCYEGEDHCPACRFLDGDHSTETLLMVIRILDRQLADEEDFTRDCIRGMVRELSDKYPMGEG